jgi:hypothetical protein
MSECLENHDLRDLLAASSMLWGYYVNNGGANPYS